MLALFCVAGLLLILLGAAEVIRVELMVRRHRKSSPHRSARKYKSYEMPHDDDEDLPSQMMYWLDDDDFKG